MLPIANNSISIKGKTGKKRKYKILNQFQEVPGLAEWNTNEHYSLCYAKFRFFFSISIPSIPLNSLTHWSLFITCL